MKKILSISLVLCLVISMLPFSTSASENESAEYTELINLAYELFPEYIENIKGNTCTTFSRGNSNSNKLITSETRQIDSNSYLAYNEYENGQIILTEVRNNDGDPFNYNLTTNSYSSGSGGKTTNITIKAAYVGLYADSGTYFKLSNVIYTTVSGGYGVINSAGSESTHGNCTIPKNGKTIVYNETASQPAKIQYQLSFHIGPYGSQFATSLLTFTLRNNSVTITHSGDDPFT